METSLHRLLAAAPADAPAITAPGRPALTHEALQRLITATLATLNTLGVGRNDRVAIVLANGPEMATCFIAAACGVTTAPLNPGYRAEEFEFYLSDLHARALIVEHDSHSPAIEVAQRLGVRGMVGVGRFEHFTAHDLAARESFVFDFEVRERGPGQAFGLDDSANG